jgi:hypothetical protein
MGRVCRETQEWVETQVEQPIESWENQQENRCRNEPCNWWVLCLNKVVCWLVWVVVKVVRIVLVTIGKWVARTICEVVNVVLDVAAFLVNLVFSIPIIGGILRTIWNWVTEVVWRLVSLPDFLLSLAGVRLRKKMYVGAIVPPNMTTTPAITDADVQRQIDAVVSFYDSSCNIGVIFTGICRTNVAAPDGSLVVSCDAGGFFSDWWVGGSWFELATATCKFTDGFRRVIGYGAEILVMVIDDVTPSGKNGCSFASTHNYVLVEAKPADQPFVAAHEIGHACWLPHDGDSANLMNPITPSAGPVLTNLQIATVRGSKHCVFI